MKKKLVALITAVVVAAGIGGYVWQSQSSTTQSAAPTSQTQTIGKIQFSTNKQLVTYTGQTGKTALANLQALTTVDTQESSYGTMVVGINGLKADSSKNYWAFYVNGAYANEGAGTYKTKAGDKLMWKLEAIQP